MTNHILFFSMKSIAHDDSQWNGERTSSLHVHGRVSKFSTRGSNPSSQVKIEKYLLVHGEATQEEIANIFNIGIDEIKSVITTLQKKGSVCVDT